MSAIKNISLYIPHVFPNFDKEFVTNAFKNIGEVSQIDFVAKQDRNGCNYNAVYVHFNKWFTNKKAVSLYESVIGSKEARLYYDNTWYWILLLNTAKKHIPGERKPRIDLSELKTISAEKEDKPSEELDASDYEFCAQMDEIEDILEQEEANLINIDGRYVQNIEAENYAMRQENYAMRQEILQLCEALMSMDMMYQAEAAKTRAFNETSVDL
jgi:hypothetical protein